MKRIALAAAMILTTLGVAGPASAQSGVHIRADFYDDAGGRFAYERDYMRNRQAFFRGGWTLLGEMRADRYMDHDSLPVGRHAGRFTKLLIAVEDDDVELSRIRVHFADGTVLAYRGRMIFREGERTGAIDLPGHARQIRKVEWETRDLRRGGRALVRVFGKEAPSRVFAPPRYRTW